MRCDRNKWLCLICGARGGQRQGPEGDIAWREKEVSYSSQWDQASFPSTPRGIQSFGSLGHCQCKWTCLYWSPGSAVDLQGPSFFSLTCEEDGCGNKTDWSIECFIIAKFSRAVKSHTFKCFFSISFHTFTILLSLLSLISNLGFLPVIDSQWRLHSSCIF